MMLNFHTFSTDGLAQYGIDYLVGGTEQRMAIGKIGPAGGTVQDFMMRYRG